MEDSALRARAFSPSSIRSQLQREPEPDPPAAVPVGEDKTDPLPVPGDAYKASGRHGNKPEMTLHFIHKGFTYDGFSYANVEQVRLVPGEKPGSGNVLIVRFHGSVVTEVTIEGRHLLTLYHWLGLHRVPWLWEHPSPAQFTDEKATVISRIIFAEIAR